MWLSETIKATHEIANQFRLGHLILLNESDLKISLANQIKKELPEKITINTESPWYDTYNTKSVFYIDITAFDSDKLQLTYDTTTKRKGYKYDDEALVIELKYFRYEEDIQSILGDFEKMKSLIKAPKNYCFIIAAARTEEIFKNAQQFMKDQMLLNKLEYSDQLKVFLFGNKKMVEII